ncbi:MAG: hypothetical protein Kow00106_09480 [Anaerolineae bacterium]
MRRFLLVMGSSLLVALVLSACGSDEPSRAVLVGDVLLSEPFDAPLSWEQGLYPPDAVTPTSQLAVIDGQYVLYHRAERTASFTWGAGVATAQDVVVEVSAEQLSSEKDNLYGVLCRLARDDEGAWSGYALLISGDGHYGIADYSRESLDFLLDWHQSAAIRQGQALNTLRAVCVDDYLALYANGKFLGEVRDGRYQRDGQVGVIAGVKAGGEVRVAFDDLTLFAGSLSSD